MSRYLAALLSLGTVFFAPIAAYAEEVPFGVHQAVVWVHCDTRQGSGVVINGEKGYVLTNAHVLIDLHTKRPGRCEVGFIKDRSLEPVLIYEATWKEYIFDESTNQDFAILTIGRPKQTQYLEFFPFLRTDEFSQVGDAVSILSYPNTANGTQSISSGVIHGLERGLIKTDAVIAPGSSGGPGVNTQNRLIGLATGILYREISPGVEEVIDYELVDIRAIITWLDTFGANAHDLYLTHGDAIRYHGPQTYVIQDNIRCSLLAKSSLSSTVYCLKGDGTRFVFPNDTTYRSWFADFSAVETLTIEQLATYRLSANVTMKPGSLIKIESDPRVYLVSDITGTLRLIPSETRAKELFGDGWAGFVKDIPPTFFQNYHVGEPIPS